MTVNNINHKIKPHLTFRLSPSLATTCGIAKWDSCVSKNYTRPENIDILSNVHPYDGHSIVLPNNEKILFNHQRQLLLSPEMTSKAKATTFFHIFPMPLLFPWVNSMMMVAR